MDDSSLWIMADWPAPPGVYAGTTLRGDDVELGFSQPPFHGFNLADHVGDDPSAVADNRQTLIRQLSLPQDSVWLQQVHGTRVVDAAKTADKLVQADAAFTTQAGVICAVLTADCLPILLCDRQGKRVAALHAGWRGLAAGVIEATLKAMQTPGQELMAWLGPAIGPEAYEVGDEVRQAFVQHDATAANAFATATRPGYWYMDIYQLARQRLAAKGVTSVYGGAYCTFSDPSRFYSYRRDGKCGRMASLVWID